MAVPRFENAVGVVDGANVVFFTPTNPYRIGSLAVYLNGQLKRADLNDGWVESQPEIGEFTLKIAPLDEDVLQVFYLDLSEVPLPEVEISGIKGTVSAVFEVAASILTMEEMAGSLVFESEVFGVHLSEVQAMGVTEDVQNVRAVLQGCDS